MRLLLFPFRRYTTTVALLLATTWLANAAPDINHLIALAKQRYSEDGVETVKQWHQVMERAGNMPESEQLTLINGFFNAQIFFADDQSIWNTSDYWATPLETMGRQQGDCEDFTIAKYISLRLLGVPNNKLRLMYVKARITGPLGTRNQAHMVLAYYPDNSNEPLILDNLIDTIEPATRRNDLTPVFGFNSEGLWLNGSTKPLVDRPEKRLSRWRDLLQRMQQDGFDETQEHNAGD